MGASTTHFAFPPRFNLFFHSSKETSMKLSKLVIAAAVAACASSLSTSAMAQAKEQFFPLLSYRTGPYAPNGTPWANGKQDYIKMINARDGGINGVKIAFEECETGYATDRGVECYERLKSRPGVACSTRNRPASPSPDRKSPRADKIPLMTLGYGLSVSQDGMAFKWNFPLMGSYWTGADILIQHIGKAWAAWTSSRARRLPWSTTTARSARSPSRCCKSAPRCTASSCRCCL
jgi:branched-chain amino acid transport system substrate-binding protein